MRSIREVCSSSYDIEVMACGENCFLKPVTRPGGDPDSPGIIQECSAPAFLQQLVNAFILRNKLAVYEVDSIFYRILGSYDMPYRLLSLFFAFM